MSEPDPTAAPPDPETPGRSALPGWAIAWLDGESPLDLRILGRTLLHAALVGVVAGLIGAGFFAGLELFQWLLLAGVAGFDPLRARGETFALPGMPASFNPWILAVLPALGGLASGILTHRFCREAAGGGGDAAIDAYHHGGLVRRRVIPIKGLAAILALSSGGSGGREGPTMQIGAAIGSAIGRLLPTTRSERRVLLVAGIAAGISAVFRTPLGAALLATEMLYRDDFEAEALVPSIFASVVSYSVVIAIFGETTLFGKLPRFGFHLSHLPIYALVALAVSAAAALFVRLLRLVQSTTVRIALPPWLAPALGGLLMGLLGTAFALYMSWAQGKASRGFGLFGGGYGALQAAVSGADWLPTGGGIVALFVIVAALKMVASALTIGSGAAAGDFAPSLVIGGLLGAAAGHAAQLLLHDPTIQPAAFALVGMGTFYGGLAHAPLSALVLVAELAGSYDLLVPMMLAIGIAYVALRRHSLYPAQRTSRVVRGGRGEERAAVSSVLSGAPPLSTLIVPSELQPFTAGAPLQDLIEAARSAERQRVALVGGSRPPRGLVDLDLLLQLPESELRWMRVDDAMVPFAALSEGATWSELASLLDRCGLPQVPIVRHDEIVGWVGDRQLRLALLKGMTSDQTSPLAGDDDSRS